MCGNITISIPVPADADTSELVLSFDKAFIFGDFGSSKTNITCISEEDFEKIFGMPIGGGYTNVHEKKMHIEASINRVMRGMYKESYQGI